MANDFHAHPDLLGLPGMERLPAASYPAPAPLLDRRLPRRFVDTGVIGFGTAAEVEFHGGRSDLENQITALVEQLTPGAVKDGYNTSVDGVRSRINQIAAGNGPAALINTGPQGRIAFHWVHRSVTGHRLMEVSVTARTRGRLEDVRGRPLAETSGLDAVLGRVTGDGSSLGRDGVVSQSQTQARSHALTFTPLALEGKHSQGPTFSMNTGSRTGRSRTSAREVRAWHRTAGHVNQYVVPYDYHVTVTSRPLTEAAVVWLLNRFGKALIWPGTVTGLAALLPRPGWLPGMATRRDAVAHADVYIRFNDSETPQPGHATVPPIPPRLLTADPTHAPAPPPDAVVIDMEVPEGLRSRLTGQPWVPARPFAVYDFNAIPELRTALRTVDPQLGSSPEPEFNQSAEATSIVLTSWASSGNPVLLTDAAAMHVLGTTARPGSTVTLRIYDPQIEISSRDQAIDDVKIATDDFAPTASHTSAPSTTLGVNTPLPAASLDVVRGPSVPVAGHSRARGGYAQQTSARREMLRYGTPAENATGQGLPGHLVHAVGVIEVRGPGGDTRWVTGNLTFRTTETPPGATPAYATRPATPPGGPAPAPSDDATPAGAKRVTAGPAQVDREAAREEGEPKEAEPKQAEADRETASTRAPADSGRRPPRYAARGPAPAQRLPAHDKGAGDRDAALAIGGSPEADAAARACPVRVPRTDPVTGEAGRADMAASGQQAPDTLTGDSTENPPVEMPATRATETVGSQHAEVLHRADTRPQGLPGPEPGGPPEIREAPPVPDEPTLTGPTPQTSDSGQQPAENKTEARQPEADREAAQQDAAAAGQQAAGQAEDDGAEARETGQRTTGEVAPEAGQQATPEQQTEVERVAAWLRQWAAGRR